MSILEHQNIEVTKWLETKCPDIISVSEYEERKIIVKGYVQSGKTTFMLCNAVRYLMNGVSSVIVLRNATGDQTQIKLRLRGLQEELKELTGESIDLCPNTSCIDSGAPGLFVVIGNSSRLLSLNKDLRKHPNFNFALFVDEADSNDTGSNKRTDELYFLKEKAIKMFFISATILDISLAKADEEPVVIDLTIDEEAEALSEDLPEEPQRVHMLCEVPHYMGIEKLVHRTLPEEALPCNKKDDDPFELDPNLAPFIEKWKGFEPHHLKLFSQFHPQHCLLSCGTVIRCQQNMFVRCARDADSVVILYNGDGIDLYHKSLVGDSIVLVVDGGRKVTGGKKCSWFDGAHSFNKNVGISEMLGWLKRNGGVDKFPRIITISGKLAGRGISFVSDDYGKYLRSFGSDGIPDIIGWRLTSMYYIPSRLTSQPNLMQAIGRVCCICRDNIPTYIYTNEDVFSDIRKAYWTQEELVARSRKIQGELSVSISDAMNQVQMNISKLSKRRLTVSGAKRIPKDNVVPWFEDDGGFQIEDVYNTGDVCDEWEFKPNPSREFMALETGLEEFERLTQKMFPLWSTSDSMISSFMHKVDPDKTYTTSEIKEHCLHEGIRLNDVVSDASGRSHKYGSIFRREKGGYKMYAELVTDYKKYF
jgi:hypothetical protein